MKKEAIFISDITKKSNVERKVQCMSCGKMFKYESELKVHANRMHLKIKDFFCDNCDKSFSSKSDLNDHISTHFGKKFTCHICGKLFNSNKNLKRHVRKNHVGKPCEKVQRFSNSFKEEVLEKVKEVGVVTARKVFGIHENTIKG